MSTWNTFIAVFLAILAAALVVYFIGLNLYGEAQLTEIRNKNRADAAHLIELKRQAETQDRQ